MKTSTNKYAARQWKYHNIHNIAQQEPAGRKHWKALTPVGTSSLAFRRSFFRLPDASTACRHTLRQTRTSRRVVIARYAASVPDIAEGCGIRAVAIWYMGGRNVPAQWLCEGSQRLSL
eukprot:3122454-Rhodomonas_salina.2